MKVINRLVRENLDAVSGNWRIARRRTANKIMKDPKLFKEVARPLIEFALNETFVHLWKEDIRKQIAINKGKKKDKE